MTVEVFATDFGPVKCGPIFSVRIKELHQEIGRYSSRAKKHKRAKEELGRIERAVEVMASLYWDAGEVLDSAP